MKKLLLTFIISFITLISFCQKGELFEDKALKFSIETEDDTIEFIIVDTILNTKKPIFLWCQGSLPIPLFCEVENYGTFFIGGGIYNFNYSNIIKNYHLVVISMPKTPIYARKENLNSSFQYITNPKYPRQFSEEYYKADYLDNYIKRAQIVLQFLQKQDWVNNNKLIVAGHSQGSKVATKLAVLNKSITHLGLFSANPFGRVDQYIREARLNAKLGKISWEKADSIMNNKYDFYKMSHNQDSINKYPQLKAWSTFSETYYDDWLNLNIPIYLAYGTEDITADLCDIVPLFFIEKKKNNLTLKRYIGLEHNFFELNNNGTTNHNKGHWIEVMDNFIKWIK